MKIKRVLHRVIVMVLLGFVITAAGVAQPQEQTFTNPLLEYRGADPWMVYYEGFYYLITTTGTPELFMYKSATLAGLREAEPIRVWNDRTLDRCCNMWAPELYQLDGPNGLRWYLYYTAGSPGKDFTATQFTHVVESEGTDPTGPYHYMGRLYDLDNDTPQLDGTILQLDDQLYFIMSVWDPGAQNLYIAPMSNPWTISGERVRISTPTYAWEKMPVPINEGPVVLQHGDDTFLVFSASGCWVPDYKLGLLTLTGADPLAPDAWRKLPEPVFERADEHGVYGPGHNGFFKSPDGTEDWIIYHANALESAGCDNRRTPRVQPFTWNADGTPDFGVPVPLDVELPVPSGEQ